MERRIVSTTKRLTLSLLEEADFDAVYEIWRDERVMRHCGGVTTKSEEAAAFTRYLRRGREGSLTIYLMRRKETHEVIGIAGFNPPRADSDAELVVHLKPEYWHVGLAKEACQAVLDIAKERTDIRVMGATVETDNLASIRLLESLGFANPKTVLEVSTNKTIARFLMNVK
jgi:ribosomal-protein-alanine N-acetyltransferase